MQEILESKYFAKSLNKRNVAKFAYSKKLFDLGTCRPF